MLNQTLNAQTLSKIEALKLRNRATFDAIKKLIDAEITSEVERLAEETEASAIYRAQGSYAKLKELSTLFEKPDIYKGLFNE